MADGTLSGQLGSGPRTFLLRHGRSRSVEPNRSANRSYLTVCARRITERQGDVLQDRNSRLGYGNLLRHVDQQQH